MSPQSPTNPGHNVRGTVAAVSATSITLHDHAGNPHTFPVSSTVKVTRSGVAATIADVKVGDQAECHVVGGTVEGIHCRPAPTQTGP
jgi:hypothetical protein